MDLSQIFLIATIMFVLIILVVQLVISLTFFRVWFKGFRGNAGVSFPELLGMTLRRINMNQIVDAKILAKQSAVFDQRLMTNAELCNWHASGVNVLEVVRYMSQQKELEKPVKDFDVLCEQYLAGKLPV